MISIPIVDTVINALKTTVDKIFPDATKAMEVKETIAKLANDTAFHAMDLEAQLRQAQIGVNNEEAKAGGFRGNWRPLAGYMCIWCIFYAGFLQPFLSTWFTMPPVEATISLQILSGLLGLGTLRTVDKVKGVG